MIESFDQAKVVRNIQLNMTRDDLSDFDDLLGEHESSRILYFADNFSLGARFNDAMASYFGLFDNIKVHSLKDLVKFNNDHADQELPPGKWESEDEGLPVLMQI